jgi:hypothetical protein
LGEVGQRLSFFPGGKRVDDGAGWNLEEAGFAVFAGAVVAAALAAVAGAGVGTEAEIDEVVDLGVHLEDDVAAAAAIAAIGPASGDEFFAVEADGAVAAVAGPGV